MFKSVIDVSVPREHVYAVLTDFPSYLNWMPGCVSARVVSQEGEPVETEMTVKGMKTMTIGLRFELQPSQFVGYKMVKGKDLKSYEGSWRLLDSPDGKGTVVRGEMEMDAGGMVPKFMMTRMGQKALDDMSAALRKRVSEVPYTPGAAPAAAPGAAPVRGKVEPRKLYHVLRTPDGYRIRTPEGTFFLSS